MYITLIGAKHLDTYLCFDNRHHQESVLGKQYDWRENV